MVFVDYALSARMLADGGNACEDFIHKSTIANHIQALLRRNTFLFSNTFHTNQFSVCQQSFRITENTHVVAVVQGYVARWLVVAFASCIFT